MDITPNILKDLIIEVAKQKFGKTIFGRREPMLATEKRVKEQGYWTKDDDKLSGSRGLKSKGLANIHWRISDLKKEGRLLNLGRDQWRVP